MSTVRNFTASDEALTESVEVSVLSPEVCARLPSELAALKGSDTFLVREGQLHLEVPLEVALAHVETSLLMMIRDALSRRAGMSELPIAGQGADHRQSPPLQLIHKAGCSVAELFSAWERLSPHVSHPLPYVVHQRRRDVVRRFEIPRIHGEQGQVHLLHNSEAGDERLDEAVLVPGHSASPSEVYFAYLSFVAGQLPKVLPSSEQAA